MRSLIFTIGLLASCVALADSSRVGAEHGEVKTAPNMWLLKSFRIHMQLESEKAGMLEPFQVVSQTLPVFPTEFLNANIVGTTVIEFTLSANGTLKDIKIKSATQPEFGAASLKAVKQWRFSPLVFRDSKRKSIAAEATFDFSIFEEGPPK
jgi:TonB family protein